MYMYVNMLIQKDCQEISILTFFFCSFLYMRFGLFSILLFFISHFHLCEVSYSEGIAAAAAERLQRFENLSSSYSPFGRFSSRGSPFFSFTLALFLSFLHIDLYLMLLYIYRLLLSHYTSTDVLFHHHPRRPFDFLILFLIFDDSFSNATTTSCCPAISVIIKKKDETTDDHSHPVCSIYIVPLSFSCLLLGPASEAKRVSLPVTPSLLLPSCYKMRMRGAKLF